MTKDTPTPRTDALTFEIEARRKLRGFNMPEDLADALNLSDQIESELTPLRAALAGLPDGALDGGWTAAGLSEYAKKLEDNLAACLAALTELVACKDAPKTAPMTGIHDYGCPCTRLGKKSGPCNCLGKAAEARIGQAWSAARAIVEGADSSAKPLGSHLAMRVLQSDLYRQLDDSERGECDALIRDFQAWLRTQTARAILQSTGEGRGSNGTSKESRNAGRSPQGSAR